MVEHIILTERQVKLLQEMEKGGKVWIGEEFWNEPKKLKR